MRISLRVSHRIQFILQFREGDGGRLKNSNFEVIFMWKDPRCTGDWLTSAWNRNSRGDVEMALEKLRSIAKSVHQFGKIYFSYLANHWSYRANPPAYSAQYSATEKVPLRFQ